MYAGLVGLYCGLAGLNDGEVGLKEGLVGEALVGPENCGELGLYCGDCQTLADDKMLKTMNLQSDCIQDLWVR